MGCIHTALNNFIFFIFAFLVFVYLICMGRDDIEKEDTKTLQADYNIKLFIFTANFCSCCVL